MTVLLAVASVRIGVWRLLLAVAMLSVPIDNCVAASPADLCTAKKYKATARKLYGKAKCRQRALLKPSFSTSECLAKVETKFIAAFARADAGGGCEAVDNASAVEEVVDDCLTSFTAAIAGDAKCAATKTKAIGRKAYDDMNCRRRAILSGAPVDAECLGKAEARLTSAIAKADGLGTCSDTVTALDALVDQCLTVLNPNSSPCSLHDWPTCGGTCDPGWTCASFCAFGCGCACVPSCVTSEAPTCGGTCPDGQLCGQASGQDFCTCATPDRTCYISDAPACGGTCPDGQLCGQVFGQCTCVASDNTCLISQTPACGGECSNGRVCGQASGKDFCTCVQPNDTCAISEAPVCGGTCANSSYYCQSQDGTSCACVCDSVAPCPFVLQWGGDGAADGQFGGARGISVDTSGDVYVADTGNHRIQKFSSTGTLLTKWGTLGAGDGQLHGPTDVAADRNGNIYVADWSNSRIQKFTIDGAFVTKWGSFGRADGQFSGPVAVAVNALGDVYVADVGNDRVQKFTTEGAFLTKWGSYGSGDGQFVGPADIAVDDSGNVFVADLGNVRIQKFTTTGTFLTKWGSAGTGDGQFGPYSGSPQVLAVDGLGNVYISDTRNARVEKFTNAGMFVAKWGCFGSGDGQLVLPVGIAVSGTGDVFVIDHANVNHGTDEYGFRVQKFACP